MCGSPTWRMGREQTPLHFQMGYFNFMHVNLPLENDCDGKFPDLSPALIQNVSLNRMNNMQNPGGLDHSGS